MPIAAIVRKNAGVRADVPGVMSPKGVDAPVAGFEDAVLVELLRAVVSSSRVVGLSSPDVGDNALGDLSYKTGRHTAPFFAGDTVFAATDVLGKREFPGRPDLGVLETRLLGHKFERDESEEHEDAPPGWPPATSASPLLTPTTAWHPFLSTLTKH